MSSLWPRGHGAHGVHYLPGSTYDYHHTINRLWTLSIKEWMHEWMNEYPADTLWRASCERGEHPGPPKLSTGRLCSSLSSLQGLSAEQSPAAVFHCSTEWIITRRNPFRVKWTFDSCLKLARLHLPEWITRDPPLSDKGGRYETWKGGDPQIKTTAGRGGMKVTLMCFDIDKKQRRGASIFS